MILWIWKRLTVFCSAPSKDVESGFRWITTCGHSKCLGKENWFSSLYRGLPRSIDWLFDWFSYLTSLFLMIWIDWLLDWFSNLTSLRWMNLFVWLIDWFLYLSSKKSSSQQLFFPDPHRPLILIDTLWFWVVLNVVNREKVNCLEFFQQWGRHQHIFSCFWFFSSFFS